MDTETAVSWASLALSGIGVVVSVGGFWVAIAQIRKTATAAEAATRAAEDAARSTRGANAHAALRQLVHLRREIDATHVASADSKEAWGRLTMLLVIWRDAAQAADGALAPLGPTLEPLRLSIQRAESLVLHAKETSAVTGSAKTGGDLAEALAMINAVADAANNILHQRGGAIL